MIGFSTDETFTGLRTSLDEHLPEERRVKLTLRAISVRESRKVRSLIAEAAAAKTADDENGFLNQALKIGIVGWDNCPHPFTDDGLDDALTTRAKYVLATEYPSLLFLAEREKKASRSPSPPAAGKSASDAPAANASTSPTA